MSYTWNTELRKTEPVWYYKTATKVDAQEINVKNPKIASFLQFGEFMLDHVRR